MNEKSLLDWKASEAIDLEAMRANTRRWARMGLIKRPEDVRIHAPKKMSDPIVRKPGRKAHAGNG